MQKTKSWPRRRGKISFQKSLVYLLEVREWVQMLTWNFLSAAVLFNQLDVTLSVLRSPVSDGVDNMANFKNLRVLFRNSHLLVEKDVRNWKGKPSMADRYGSALSRVKWGRKVVAAGGRSAERRLYWQASSSRQATLSNTARTFEKPEKSGMYLDANSPHAAIFPMSRSTESDRE